jgi:hypothetical protein
MTEALLEVKPVESSAADSRLIDLLVRSASFPFDGKTQASLPIFLRNF